MRPKRSADVLFCTFSCKLFEKYRRAAEGKKREGTGLGLFIVKSLVEAHGGRVEVESTVGAGSCFSVFLSAAAVPIH